MKKAIITIVIGGIVIVGIVAFLGSGSPQTSEELGDLGTIPNLTLKDYEGNDVRLSSFGGKVAVVNSWAVWCPFCRDELPDFGKLQEEFGDRIVVIAIDRQESLQKAKEYTDSLGVTEEMIFLLDPSDSFYKSIGGFSMPETIFVDQSGIIRVHKRGPMPLSEMRERVELLLSLGDQ